MTPPNIESIKRYAFKIHQIILGYIKAQLIIKPDTIDNNKSKAEAYLMFSYILINNLEIKLKNKDVSAMLIGELKSIRLMHLKHLDVNIQTQERINELLNRRSKIYDNADANKLLRIEDLIPGFKYLNTNPSKEYINPRYEEAKNNPAYKLITDTLKKWYHVIRNIDLNESVSEMDYQKWIHSSSKSFGQIVFMIYEKPLAEEIKTSSDYEFIYTDFGDNLSESLRQIEIFTLELSTLL